ncbi:hypothetical protein EDC96DRAFT_592445, partial [Choanephora cucurbitarum]
MEWHHWQPERDLEPKSKKVETEPSLKRLMDLDAFFQAQHDVDKSTKNEKTVEFVKTEKASSNSKVRGNYRSYAPQQIQELLDLVIEQGMSARQAGLSVGIAVRTAQHYVKLYKDDEEKRLPGVVRAKKGGVSKKLNAQHTSFLIDFYEKKNAAAVLWEARDALLSAFPDLGSISLSSLHYHLTKHASLTLKKLEKLVKARNADTTLEQRKEKVLQWKADREMSWEENCVFIDEAGFNLHIRRNFGRSKRGLPAES